MNEEPGKSRDKVEKALFVVRAKRRQGRRMKERGGGEKEGKEEN